MRREVMGSAADNTMGRDWDEEYVSTFSTDNMALAAYLMYLGHELQDLEWELTSCYFLFEETMELSTSVVDFFTDRATVAPQRYNTTFSQLKKRVFDENPNPPPRRRQRTRTHR
jgi:hypothetical protein